MGKKSNHDDWQDVRAIYQLLKDGKGWPMVTPRNVDELRTMAMADEDKTLEQKLRDWR